MGTDYGSYAEALEQLELCSLVKRRKISFEVSARASKSLSAIGLCFLLLDMPGIAETSGMQTNLMLPNVEPPGKENPPFQLLLID